MATATPCLHRVTMTLNLQMPLAPFPKLPSVPAHAGLVEDHSPWGTDNSETHCSPAPMLVPTLKHHEVMQAPDQSFLPASVIKILLFLSAPTLSLISVFNV